MRPHKHVAAVFLLAGVCAGCNADFEPPDVQSMHEAQPLGEARELRVDLRYEVGQLEITKTPDENLFSLDLQYDRHRFDPKFHFDGGDRASVSLDVKGNGIGNGGGRDNDLTLRLTDKIPLDLEVTAGVVESHLEMTSLQIRRLHLRGGVGKTDVTFDKELMEPMRSLDIESGVGELAIHGLGNAHVEHVDFKGGVGHAELDFTGELGASRSEAHIKVGIGSIRLIIPRDTDVDIEGHGGFLSNISAPSFDHHDRTYTHHGEGKSQIHITVESGIGSVEVELI